MDFEPVSERPFRSKADLTRLAERSDRLGPKTAGAIAGALGGAATLLATNELVVRRGGANVISLLGHAMSRGAFTGTNATVLAFVTMVGAGMLFGIGFAAMTRHLRRFVPTLFFSIVLLASAWTALYALVVRFRFPALASVVPFVPSLTGALVLAVIIAMNVPLRVRV